jgi:hypothetical protein
MICTKGHTLAVELLCQWNADASAVDAVGKTPLDYSAEEHQGDAIIETLVRKLERDLDYPHYGNGLEGDRMLQLAEEERKMTPKSLFLSIDVHKDD